MSRIKRQDVHSFIHILALAGIAGGLSIGKAVISIAFFLLILNLLFEGKFRQYASNVRSNRLLLILILFYTYHALSLIWTDNLAFGIHDLKVKLPILIIPIIVAAKPIKKNKDLIYILYAFILSAFVISLINFGAYHQWFGHRVYDDIRGMSLFGHHIRFALIITMSIAVLLYTMKQSKFKLIFLIFILWFSFYTVHSQVLSGIITLFAVFTIYFLHLIWKKKKILALLLGGLLIIKISVAVIWIFKPIKLNKKDYTNLPAFTINGNPYSHDLTHISPESGEPIAVNLCEKELSLEWNKVSNIEYHSVDEKGRLIRLTLIRYLASKSLTKDSLGFSKLNKNDIQKIENGIPGDYTFGFMERFYALKFQLINEKDPNGHSLLMRFEFWKTGVEIWKNHFFFGTGSGDVQDEFNAEYEKNNSPLKPENRNRAHNMYLTYALSLGIPGLLLFIWYHIQFLRFNFKRKNWIGINFILIILISYLMEDTLESQVGATFFALFAGIYGIIIPENDQDDLAIK